MRPCRSSICFKASYEDKHYKAEKRSYFERFFYKSNVSIDNSIQLEPTKSFNELQNIGEVLNDIETEFRDKNIFNKPNGKKMCHSTLIDGVEHTLKKFTRKVTETDSYMNFNSNSVVNTPKDTPKNKTPTPAINIIQKESEKFLSINRKNSIMNTISKMNCSVSVISMGSYKNSMFSSRNSAYSKASTKKMQKSVRSYNKGIQL